MLAPPVVKTHYKIQHRTPAGIWETLPYGHDFDSINEATDFIGTIERPEYFENYRIIQITEHIAATFDKTKPEEPVQE